MCKILNKSKCELNFQVLPFTYFPHHYNAHQQLAIKTLNLQPVSSSKFLKVKVTRHLYLDRKTLLQCVHNKDTYYNLCVHTNLRKNTIHAYIHSSTCPPTHMYYKNLEKHTCAYLQAHDG